MCTPLPSAAFCKPDAASISRRSEGTDLWEGSWLTHRCPPALQVPAEEPRTWGAASTEREGWAHFLRTGCSHRPLQEEPEKADWVVASSKGTVLHLCLWGCQHEHRPSAPRPSISPAVSRIPKGQRPGHTNAGESLQTRYL